MKKSQHRHKILVIEDQEDVRENIEELLELSNYEVITSANGKDGVKKAIENPPDLILCDIMMPAMDGYEVLYLISRNPNTARIPFIFLTAKADKQDLRKGMNLGADDYITKPFEEMDLLEAIERRINRYENLKDASELFPLLKAIDSGDMSKKLEDPGKLRVFEPGDIIYREGDFGTYVYQIKKGVVKTFKANREGKELVHNLLQAGDFIGEQAVIQDTPRTEYAEALEKTELLLIPRNEFQELIFSDREISGQFIRIMSKNIIDREKELLDMAYNTVRKRTADAIVKLHKTFGQPESESGSNKETAGIEFSRSNLANMVGTATESVIRVLSEFKKDGLIDIVGSQIIIEDIHRIEAIKV